MSMYLTTYVGPYFKVHGLPQSLLERHEAIVTDCRGELFSDNPVGVTYLVPNCQLTGVTRQMRFSRDDEMPVVEITAEVIADEMRSFAIEAEKFLVDCNAAGIDVIRYWGIVCDYS